MQVSHLGFIWPVNDADGNREDGVTLERSTVRRRLSGPKHVGAAYLSFIPDRIIDHVMVLHHLLLDGVLQILHSRFHLLQVDVAKTSVKQDLARV